MVKEDYSMNMVQVIINAENNPITWTEEDLLTYTNRKVVVGYLFKNMMSQFGTTGFILNLYTINPFFLETREAMVSLNTLQNAFLQWIDMLSESDQPAANIMLFKNPPITEWLDTKENWVKKLASKLSITYQKPFDECVSAIHFIIMKCYNSGNVYMGNLTYLEVASHNKIKLEMRYMKNRLTGEHPDARHLDATIDDFGGGGDYDGDKPQSLHEVLGGKRDDIYLLEDYEALREAIIDDLLKTFSPREIDQILNNPKQLPMPLYRKLNAWRKEHKLEDYK